SSGLQPCLFELLSGIFDGFSMTRRAGQASFELVACQHLHVRPPTGGRCIALVLRKTSKTPKQRDKYRCHFHQVAPQTASLGSSTHQISHAAPFEIESLRCARCGAANEAAQSEARGRRRKKRLSR